MKRELENNYKDKTLAEMNIIAKGYRGKGRSYYGDFILALYYIRHTGLFRKDPRYKKESFEVFLEDTYQLRIGTFDNHAWVFHLHYKAAIKHGPGIIDKIKRVCGVMNVRKVLNEIDKLEKRRKTPLPRDKKEAIILKYAKPESIEKAADKEPRTVVENKLSKAKEVIHDNSKIIFEQSDQIEKLKATVEKLKAENTELRATVEKYKAKEKEFMVLLSPAVDFIKDGASEIATA